MLALSSALALTFASTALAKRQQEFAYPYERVWNVALRLLRVDMRLEIKDRDQEAGYLLFDYVDHGKTYPGSLELIKGERDQRPYVSAVVQVTGMPSYVEQLVLDKLDRKLKAELGAPLEPKKPEPEKPKQPEKKPPAEGSEGEGAPTDENPQAHESER